MEVESKDPIDGVEFRYAKVGDLYQIVDGNKISWRMVWKLRLQLRLKSLQQRIIT